MSGSELVHDKDKTGHVLIAVTGEGGSVLLIFSAEQLTRMGASRCSVQALVCARLMDPESGLLLLLW